MRKDRFHDAVCRALEKEGWVITADPLKFETGEMSFEIDLAAEKFIAAEKEGQKIAVEIKAFLDQSLVAAFQKAMGQYDSYALGMELYEPDRIVYLAVPNIIYQTFFQRPFVKLFLERKQIRYFVYKPTKELIIKWIH